VPPLGQAYGVPVIWDDALSACPDIYFEAGDHRDLVHMSGQAFRTLMANADHARISHPA
jgi:Ala-tRNA(Pro) deacylase